MRLLLAVAILGACALPGSPAAAQEKSSLTREKGAVYLEDISREPVSLRLKAGAPVYADLQGRRSLGTLVPDQQVTLLAFSDRAARVRGRAHHDTVAGWIALHHLQPPRDDFFETLKRIAARNEQVQQFIARKEIAVGMTTDEVIQSLGRPSAESSQSTATEQRHSFDYITYERVPQRTVGRDRLGRLVSTIVYVKVETGRLTVHFKNDVVESIESAQGQPELSGPRLVVPPISIW